MTIDGEELSMQCKQCGTKYSYVLGYGPVCPNELLRQMKLRNNPPHCPKCGSNLYKRLSLLGRLIEIFK